jgi:hypothetical protein
MVTEDTELMVDFVVTVCKQFATGKAEDMGLKDSALETIASIHALSASLLLIIRGTDITAVTIHRSPPSSYPPIIPLLGPLSPSPPTNLLTNIHNRKAKDILLH